MSVSVISRRLHGSTEIPNTQYYLERQADGRETLALRTRGPMLDEFAGEQRRLTQREIAIVSLIAAGHSNKAIAIQLGVAPETIKTHLKRIFLKLSARTRAEAVVRVKRTGLMHCPNAFAVILKPAHELRYGNDCEGGSCLSVTMTSKLAKSSMRHTTQRCSKPATLTHPLARRS